MNLTTQEATAVAKPFVTPAFSHAGIVYSLAADVRSGKSVPEVSQELGVSSRDVGELARRQCLITVAGAEQGVPCIIRSNAPEILMDWLRSKKASDGAEPGLPLPAAAATLSVSVAEMVEMVRDGRARVAGLKDGPG
ncbi:hypothetical protein BPNPMPFG_006877 (plasmid) [Mesorhizobium sp. AR07]|uniref:hypothetical protein n=1 Tax=Mesorhizobium sp. AR07 TaxID=2865838 RepID=UPI00215F28AA|nr:hypothetical protein [Mesorhizobium sp. AR07]UVK49155.1 hypothetical protein BPNPMPFG_006877 [Mesorhizobium sp. AR07]